MFHVKNDFRLCLLSAFLVLLGVLDVPMPSVSWAACQNPVMSAPSKYLFGSMETDGRQFRFVIEVLSGTTAGTTAELTSWDESNMKFQLVEFSMDDLNLKFKIKESKASYEGTRTDVQQPYTGTWSQRNSKIELKFSNQDIKPADEPKEIWTGILQAGPQKLNVQFRGYREPDGKIRYYFDSVSQKAGGFIGEGSREERALKLVFPAIGAKFDGTISVDEQSIEGKFTQGIEIGLKLSRSKELAVLNPPKRPQLPQSPFPYTARDIEFPSEQDKIKLAGTLTIPNDSKNDSKNDSRKYPLAILISGSGPQDRDETLFDHKPFLVIADHLTRNGIAVLRFDERGVGKSTGKFEGATSEDFARDVEAAIVYAKTLPEIDAARIGLIGHSEGGYVAPMIAAKDQTIAFVVMLAGPGVNGEQIMYSQGRLLAQAMGASEDELKRIRIGQELALEQVKKLEPGEKLSKQLGSMVDEVFDSLKEQGLIEVGKEAEVRAGLAANIKAMSDPWFQFFIKHEPGPDLEKLKCPVLALNGTKDLQVDYKLNLPAIEASLKKGGHKDFMIKEMENLNHLFQKCITGSAVEYGEIEETFNSDALSVMTTWIRSKVVIL